MNNIDKSYQLLLQDILDNGVEKSDRTGTGTISVFGRQIRHKMSEGFPLLTTKKMAWKTMVTELLWFLRGDTNIKFLVDNDCHIWDGDAYKNYLNLATKVDENGKIVNLTYPENALSKEEFINKIKQNEWDFAKTWGELGPIYGKQWRGWNGVDREAFFNSDNLDERNRDARHGMFYKESDIDQIQNLINDLKTNPDSRRLMVNAWNVGELDQMVLPPCHYGFQVYTRELSLEERHELQTKMFNGLHYFPYSLDGEEGLHKEYDKQNVPRRAISLMWNQRSVDTFLGLPFNIASYGLLLEIIAKIVNMVPDQLIGNLGDTHLYLDHLEQAKEQIGRELTLKERIELWEQLPNKDIMDFPIGPLTDEQYHTVLSSLDIPKRTREPYPLPTLNIQKTSDFWKDFTVDQFSHLDTIDFQIENYQSHPTIKAPLSN
mgnify:CR=1 FL=1